MCWVRSTVMASGHFAMSAVSILGDGRWSFTHSTGLKQRDSIATILNTVYLGGKIMPADSAGTPRYRLRVPGIPFQNSIASLIIAVQMVLWVMAALTLVFWADLVISSTYHPWMFKPGLFWEYFSVDWHPEAFLAAIGMGTLAMALNYLYVESAT